MRNASIKLIETKLIKVINELIFKHINQIN